MTGATTYDVLVVGSGAGALVSAIRAHDLGLSVLVIEKSDCYGGISAVSGGGIWIPCNPQMEAAGINDSYEDAFDYMKAAAEGRSTDDRIHAYLKNAPRLLAWLQEKVRLRYHAVPRYPDYYPHLPGWKTGARTMEPGFFNAGELGKDLSNLREPIQGTLLMGRIAMGQREAHTLMSREKGWVSLLVKLMLGYWLNLPARFKGKRDTRLALGNAMIGTLRKSMTERGIPLWLETPLKQLITENGRVAGAVVKHRGAELRLHARRGVILACGGFERNQQMREQFLPAPTQVNWTATPPGNTGDGILAGQNAGAALDLMELAWWVPTVAVPGADRQWPVFIERASPGCIIVNRRGRRFVNEAAPYQEFIEAMYGPDRDGANIPAWAVFDAHFRHKYPFGPLLPASIQPESRLPAHWLGEVYHRANSLEELAAGIGVDVSGLAESVERNNEYARTGSDLDFGKGENAHDTYYADANVTPNHCLAPIAKGPYYAVQLDAGDTGTKGGLATDTDARVLREDGRPITGLYAIGNCSASVMGAGYPGPGSTLGPAMTFGYLAANHLAGATDSMTEETDGHVAAG